MRNDFGVFILTHGRPDNVVTFDTLQAGGYTGSVWLVVDDEDAALPAYRRRYGDKVLTFSKDAIAEQFDVGDNWNFKRSVFYARNACWQLALDLGLRYFVQLDDDYHEIALRFARDWSFTWFKPRTRGGLDRMFSACVKMLDASQAASLCLAQGGDYFGGFPPGKPLCVARRKAMNSFFCDASRPFAFQGEINEDVNTYTEGGRRGVLFLTTMLASIHQMQTQAAQGGMSELYLDTGTYLKSCYSVLYCPSAVRVGTMGDPNGQQRRIHHVINWRHCAAKIVRESVRKPREP